MQCKNRNFLNISLYLKLWLDIMLGANTQNVQLTDISVDNDQRKYSITNHSDFLEARAIKDCIERTDSLHNKKKSHRKLMR